MVKLYSKTKIMNKSKIILYSILTILLLGAIYFRTNTATIYANMANFHYKHNNISKSQIYYEKSFAHGNIDTDTRLFYVNSIINSPLTLSSQEKLVRIAEDKLQDRASYKAKEFLYNLKREIHNQYPLNYVKQATYNQQIVHWGKFPVTYTFLNPEVAPAEYVEEINQAFSMWERVGIPFTRTSGKADITVDFLNTKTDDIENGKKYVVAYTVPNISTTKLLGMNIHFYIQSPDGNFFSNNQIYNTALHEIFHALGFMGHSFEPDNIMYLAKDRENIINDTRVNLTEADISTLKLLYKIKPDITNDNKLKSEYVPYLVLGDEEEINISKVREAKNYIYNAPALPSGYIDMAESLVAQKKYSEAIKNLEKALRLADNDEIRYIVYYDLAVAYNYINHPEMAYDYITRAENIKSDEELHFLKAEVLLKINKAEAIKEYEYLTGVSPQNIEYAVRYANIYIKNKNYLKARKILKHLIKNNPNAKKDERLSPYKILLFL